MKEQAIILEKLWTNSFSEKNDFSDDDFDDIYAVYAQGIAGSFGVLPNHIPFMSALDIGVTKVMQGGKPRYFTTMGGIFQFQGNEAVILTDTAEDGNDIDVVRAKEALKRAQARLAEKSAELDAKRAEAAIARAMANEPSIILADEPTGALDSETSAKVMDIFKKLNKDFGKTIILITHNSELAEQCDRILTLKDGRFTGERRNNNG